jgi:CHAD domain-containing protein
VLGGPRESDVNVAILEQRKSAVEPSLRLALELLLGFEHERQARLRARMQRQLRKIDLQEIDRCLSPPPGRRGEGRWLLPLHRFAARHIDPARRSVERLWDRASARPSEQNLHTLRIALKKLRYTLEILSPALVARRRASTLSRLRSLQDGLGNLNDLTVLRRQVVERRRSFDALALPGLSGALRSVDGYLSEEIRARRAAVVARLREERERGFLEGLSSGLLR